METLLRVNAQCSEYLSDVSNEPDVAPSNPNIPFIPNRRLLAIWRPPRPSCVKFNIDASFNPDKRKGMAGIIERDEKVTRISATFKLIFPSSPLMAEALSLREVVSFAINTSRTRVINESDNLALVEACRKDLIKGEIRGIVNDILNFKSNFEHSEFTLVGEDGNLVAHSIAVLVKDG